MAIRKQTRKAAARDSIGADSTSERDRLQARIEQLQHEKRLLEIKCCGLEAEIDDLKHERAILQVAVQKQES